MSLFFLLNPKTHKGVYDEDVLIHKKKDSLLEGRKVYTLEEKRALRKKRKKQLAIILPWLIDE